MSRHQAWPDAWWEEEHGRRRDKVGLPGGDGANQRLDGTVMEARRPVAGGGGVESAGNEPALRADDDEEKDAGERTSGGERAVEDKVERRSHEE